MTPLTFLCVERNEESPVLAATHTQHIDAADTHTRSHGDVMLQINGLWERCQPYACVCTACVIRVCTHVTTHVEREVPPSTRQFYPPNLNMCICRKDEERFPGLLFSTLCLQMEYADSQESHSSSTSSPCEIKVFDNSSVSAATSSIRAALVSNIAIAATTTSAASPGSPDRQQCSSTTQPASEGIHLLAAASVS